MLVATREMLLAHLLELPALTDLYAARDPDFVGATLTWLAACEATLQRLRSPLAALVAAERSKILAAGDGYREGGQVAESANPRKVIRVVASRALARAEAELRAVVVATDERLHGLREKMAQLLAVASTAHSLPLPGDMPREQWLSTVWQLLRQSVEGRSMAAYLSGALQPADLWCVLGDTLDNLIAASEIQHAN